MRQKADSLAIAERVAKSRGLRKAIEDLVAENIQYEIFIVVDNVLANFPDHFFTYLGLPREAPINMDDRRFVFNYYKIHQDNDFWLTIPPYEKIDGFPVSTYISNRHPDLSPVTEKWLRYHGNPDAPLLNLWHEDKLASIPNRSFLLGDDIRYYQSLKHKGVNAYLMDRPWNQNFETVDRVYCLDEFYSRVYNKPFEL